MGEEDVLHMLREIPDGSDPIAMIRHGDWIFYELDNGRLDDLSDEEREDTQSRAIHCYINAARAGVTEGARKAAMRLWSTGRKGEARRWMREAAKERDVLAAKILAGWLWSEGEESASANRRQNDTDEEEDGLDDLDEDEYDGTDRSDKKLRGSPAQRQAFRLWLKAANQDGDISSIKRVAHCYATGEGVGAVDVLKAMEYWEKAAAKGDSHATSILVRYYYEHIMAPDNTPHKQILPSDQQLPDNTLLEDYQEEEESIHSRLLRYMQRAAADGDPFALRSLAQAHQKGFKDVLAKDVVTAVQLYMKAASEGDLSSRAAAADIFYNGEDGVPQDRSHAFRLYAEAAKQGTTMPSLRALADCYRTGDGAPDDKPNLPLAFAYYEEAARQGDNHSLKILGDLYWHGDGCVKDRAKAADFYENAVASGESESLHCLARCYWFGKGVERDKSLARDLWKQYLVTKQDLVPPDELSGLISLPDEDLEEIMEKLDEQTAL